MKSSRSKRSNLNLWFRIRWIYWFRITRPFRVVGKALSPLFNLQFVTLALLVLALFTYSRFSLTISDLAPNIVTDLLGVALAVLLLDKLYRRRSDSERKKVLITKLGSKNNAVASEALKELSARRWLGDGTLRKASIMSANLDGNSFTGADLQGTAFSFASLRDTTWFEADLTGAFLDHVDLRDASLSMHAVGPHYAEADLTEATLTSADLRGARVRDQQLVKARSLWRARMPNGRVYNGRYNLPYDIELHLKFAEKPDDPSEWAQFYGVTVKEYVAGQAWAGENPELSNPPISA